MEQTLQKMLEDRKLPPLKEKQEMLSLLLEEEYGHLPPLPTELSFEVQEKYIKSFCAGKADAKKVIARGKVNGREFSFPFYATIPTKEGKYPFFVMINFRDAVPDRYMPTEELVDNGFAVLSFCYKDVTSDNGDFTDGIAGAVYENGERAPRDGGKIALWAWAAQRVMDFAEENPEKLDLTRAIVCGHSRLGKTALLTAATDERFFCAYSNDSGCCGSALSRGKEGERLSNILTKFPFWFCEHFKEYADREEVLPFDQHYLIASIAPRLVCVGSATLDAWADPPSEMLSCLAASPAFEEKGLVGLCHEGRLAQSGESFFDGAIGYHLREGLHYFSRGDWNQLIRFLRRHS